MCSSMNDQHARIPSEISQLPFLLHVADCSYLYTHIQNGIWLTALVPERIYNIGTLWTVLTYFSV